jgi:hypothetical protein
MSCLPGTDPDVAHADAAESDGATYGLVPSLRRFVHRL